MFKNKDYILTIFREGSFSKAAELLYISQPSLSATVKRIEGKISSPIFDRSTTPVSLTKIGIEYVKYALEIEEKEKSFARFVDDSINLLSGTIHIGGSSLFSSYLLPKMISDFNKRYPQIRFEISEDNTRNLIKKLSEGRLDFVIDNTDDIFENIESRIYTPELLLLAVPKTFQINESLKHLRFTTDEIKSGKHAEGSRFVNLKHFEGEPFILLNPENDTGKRAVKLFKKYAMTPNVIFQIEQQVTAYNIACTQMGVSFISDTLIKHIDSENSLYYYRLKDAETQRNIFIYMKKNKYLSHACRTFIKSTTQSSRSEG